MKRKLICTLISAASILALTACSGGNSAGAESTNASDTTESTEAEENAEEETASASGYAAGEYSVEVTGMGTINVTVTIDDSGAIADCTIDGPNETPELGGAAIPKLQAAVLEAQSADIDVVSGATITSTAVINAVTDCLGQASGQ